MSKEAEKSENVVAMEVEESEEDKQERLKQESIALAIAGTSCPVPECASTIDPYQHNC